jgi:hypothetical protein
MAGVAFLYWLAAMLIDNEVVAQGDIEPPRMLSMKVEPTFVDTSLSDQPITLTVKVTDDLAGLSFGRVGFARHDVVGGPALPDISIRFSLDDLVSGTSIDGVFRSTALLPQYSAEGRWYVWEVYLEDDAHNTCGWQRTSEGLEPCAPAGDLPYFVNVTDSGPPATATPMPTSTPSPTPTSTPDLIATETAISQHIATSVAATLTAIARPSPESTMTPQPGHLYLPSLKE